MRVCLNGRGGKVGAALAPALEAAGHTLVELPDADAMVDFTAPEAAVPNILAALEQAQGKLYGRGGAAELLSIKATTLASRMKALGIKRPRA